MNAPIPPQADDKQRLFIAVPLPETLKRTIGAWTRELRASVPFRKWTDEADLHVTLQFLGDTAPSRVPALVDALRAAAGSGMAPPFRLSLRRTGTFGRPEQPRVFWAGIDGELEQLHRLRRIVAESTAPLGFAAEERPYSPHLTVARKYAGEEPFVLPELPGDEAEPLSWLVDEIVLYRTHMHRLPMYEAAARIPLL